MRIEALNDRGLFFRPLQGPRVLASCRVMRGTPGIIAITRRANVTFVEFMAPSFSRTQLVTIRSLRGIPGARNYLRIFSEI